VVAILVDQNIHNASNRGCQKSSQIFVGLALLIFIGLFFNVGLSTLQDWFVRPSLWEISSYSNQFMHLNTIELSSLRRSAKHGSEEVFIIHKGEEIIYINGNQLKRINILTGEVQWEFKKNTGVSGITNNSQIVFLSHDSEAPAKYASDVRLIEPGAIAITALDIESGQILWASSYPGIQYVSHIDANEGLLGVNGHNGHGLNNTTITLSASTGSILNTPFQGLGYPQNAFTRLSGEVIYYNEIDQSERGLLIFSNTHNKIFALDPTTDIIQWTTDIPNMLGNFAFSNGAVFFLTRDSVLWALDEETGKKLGSVNFQPANPALVEPLKNYVEPTIFVSANEDIVLAHFSVRSQLFAFRFLSGE